MLCAQVLFYINVTFLLLHLLGLELYVAFIICVVYCLLYVNTQGRARFPKILLDDFRIIGQLRVGAVTNQNHVTGLQRLTICGTDDDSTGTVVVIYVIVSLSSSQFWFLFYYCLLFVDIF